MQDIWPLKSRFATAEDARKHPGKNPGLLIAAPAAAAACRKRRKTRHRSLPEGGDVRLSAEPAKWDGWRLS